METWLLSKWFDRALRAGNALFSVITLAIGLLMLIPSLYFLVAQPEQPSWASMEQACKDAAAMNNASPTDTVYLGQCMDGWAISNNLIAPMASVFFLILGTIISALGFWRVWNLFKIKKDVKNV